MFFRGFFPPPPFKELFFSCFLLVIIVATAAAAASCSVEEEFVNRSPATKIISQFGFCKPPPPVDHKSVRSFGALLLFDLFVFFFVKGISSLRLLATTTACVFVVVVVVVGVVVLSKFHVCSF